MTQITPIPTILSAVLKEVRPRQWMKNLLVFAPLFFAQMVSDVARFSTTAQLFVVFCLCASSVYIFNDVIDKTEDQKHPLKKHRPIASGQLSIAHAVVLCVVFLTIAALLSAAFPLKTQLTVVAYIFLNVLYSLWLKRIAIVEIFTITAMYIFRIIAGGTAIAVSISSWIILVTFFLSLFLIVGKRRVEIERNAHNGTTNGDTRMVLAQYSPAFLNELLAIAIAGASIAYGLYTVETGIPYLLYTSAFVMFGLFRYLYAIHHKTAVEAPEMMVTHDPWIAGTVLAWVISICIIFYA